MVEAAAFNPESDDDGGGPEEKYFNSEFVGKCKFKLVFIFCSLWVCFLRGCSLVYPRLDQSGKTQRYGKFINTKFQQEFTQDFPALLEQAVSFKKELQEGKKKPFSESQILAQNFELSEADYTVKLALGLLSACSLMEKIPNLIARIILNNIAIMASDGLLILSDEHKKWAKDHLQNCRADLIFDFV